jgi:hypothetical protein
LDGTIIFDGFVIAGLIGFAVGVNWLHKAMRLWQTRAEGMDEGWFDRWLVRVMGAEGLPRTKFERWMQVASAIRYAVMGTGVTLFSCLWLYDRLDFL